MNLLEDLPDESNYQFPRWPTSASRPQSSLTSKDVGKDMFRLGIDNRNQFQRPQSSSITTKRIIKHHVSIPTGTRLPSPPPQPSTSPDLDVKLEHSLPKSRNPHFYRSIPVRIKSTALTIPIFKRKEEISLQHFPRQTYEQRKLTHEKKRRKQQAQILADKYAETETWFQLRRSLSELKRLAATQDMLTDSNISCDGHSLITLKQITDEENKKLAIIHSESGILSSFGSVISSYESNRVSMTASQNSFFHPRTTKQSFETYSQLVFKPIIVASKPIHRVIPTANHHSSIKANLKPPPPSPLYRSRPITTPLSDLKRAQLLLSDLSNDDNLPRSTTSSPPLIRIEREIVPRKIPTRPRAPSSMQLTSTIKLKPQTLRCHSATDIKSPYSTNKHSLRFIIIVDQEHRIESWYHQYPFIHSDDLLKSFQSKQLEQKSTISAFFIDDFQSSNLNRTGKTFLQGKSFDIKNDWKKYDLIFISNNIYPQIIIYLQTIINLIKSSGKRIQIYQINHEEDLKKQVKNICKLQQQHI